LKNITEQYILNISCKQVLNRVTMKYYPVFMDIKDKNCLIVADSNIEANTPRILRSN